MAGLQKDVSARSFRTRERDAGGGTCDAAPQQQPSAFSGMFCLSKARESAPPQPLLALKMSQLRQLAVDGTV